MGYEDHVYCARRSHGIKPVPPYNYEQRLKSRTEYTSEQIYPERGTSVQDLPSGEIWFL